MKRNRVLVFDFDSRALMLNMEIKDEWEEKIKEGHRKNKSDLIRGLIQEFGELGSEEKIKNFCELGPKPFSIIAFHNYFAAQNRSAFTIGSFYSALTGTCALGERILNHLILALKEHYRSTIQYKEIFRKDSFDNWDLAISTLKAWGVLLPDSIQAFNTLKTIRNQAIHFRPETDKNDRALALEAIRSLDKIILCQFSGLGTQPWFIPGTPGESYIRREHENSPFVRTIYLPNCRFVGPDHELEFSDGRFIVRDRDDYEQIEISDDEFRERRRVSKGASHRKST